MPESPKYLTRINQDGTEYNIKDIVSGYITRDDLPAIIVNPATKTLIITTTTVENADVQDF